MNSLILSLLVQRNMTTTKINVALKINSVSIHLNNSIIIVTLVLKYAQKHFSSINILCQKLPCYKCKEKN